jgi:putative transposase
MTQYQITLDSQLLHQLFLSESRDAGIAALLESILNQVLQAQATDQLKAGHYERSEERAGYRNGSYPHRLTTRVGQLTLQVPRFRNGQFSTELFSRYQRSEQALVLAMMEMVLNGVSTRKVSNITEELCGTEFSKSTVSELCKQLDPLVEEWNNRKLDKAYPFLIVDALYVKVREDGRVRSRGVMIATGINAEGYRELLGLTVDDTESAATWGAFFTHLKSRGLHGVDVITSDHHSGLVSAIRQHFQGVTWQRCQTHFMRNILDAAPKSCRDELKAHVRAIYEAADETSARTLLKRTQEAFEDKAPKAMRVLEEGFDDATAILALPAACRIRTRTTNAVERLNGELRRRERVIRIFPNRAAVLRLFGALLIEQDEKWSAGKKYIEMKEYHEWRKKLTRPAA